MTDARRIVWLASYPKSGNTWARIFLANYLANPAKPLTLGETLQYSVNDSSAYLYDQAAGHRLDRDNFPLVLSLRDRVLKGVVAGGADVYLMKTHNCRSRFYGVDLIPPGLSKAAIYIVRNPLDMIVSSARHYGVDVERACEIMSTPDRVLASNDKVMPAFLGSWSQHAKSWTSFSPYPTLVLRYEDMLNQPQDSFGKMLRHLGIPPDRDRLDKAVRFSSFDELKKQEETAGFVEKPDQAERFFASGKTDQWKSALSAGLVDRVCRDHGEMMHKYGYLE